MREKIPRLELWVRGVYHKFERYHPRLKSFPDEEEDPGWKFNGRYCGHCAPKKVLFFAHEDCWKLVKGHGISARKLYQFAVQTQPLLPWRSDKPHCRPLEVFHCADVLNSGTSLGELVAEISRRLPLELQQCIIAELQRSVASTMEDSPFGRYRDRWVATHQSGDVLFTRFATIMAHTIPVLKQFSTNATNVLKFHPAQSSVPDASSPDSASHSYETLYVLTGEIFGRSYISKIGRNREGPGVLSIVLTPSVIRGVRFALGRFGLRAIRILYDDGSRSPWLGDPSGCWFGNEPARQVGRFPSESVIESQLLDLVATATVRINMPLGVGGPTCNVSRTTPAANRRMSM